MTKLKFSSINYSYINKVLSNNANKLRWIISTPNSILIFYENINYILKI